MSWRINQNHGCYRFGSSYPTQKRLQIIVTFLETLSIANTSRICRVSYNCVDQYVRLFQQRATLMPSVCNKDTDTCERFPSGSRRCSIYSINSETVHKAPHHSKEMHSRGSGKDDTLQSPLSSTFFSMAKDC